MKRPVWGKVGIVALLLIAIVAVAQMKQQAGPAPTSGTGTAPASGPAASGSSTGLPRLLDLGSTSCIPCKMMAPILEELKAAHAGKLQVDFIDVWKDKEAGAKYGVEAIPAQIIFDASGKELYRHTGFYSKEDILAKLKELGVKL